MSGPGTEHHIFDISPDEYPRMVLDNSHRGPVLVYYWSPAAGPCNMLLPRLVKLADEAAGRFLLLLLDTQRHGRFARDQGIRSIPTVRIYVDGKPVETIHGAWSEAEFRRVLEKYAASRRSAAHAAALSSVGSGDEDTAILLLRRATRSGSDWRASVDLVKLLLRQNAFDEVIQEVAKLVRREDIPGDVCRLITHLEMIAIAHLPRPETDPDTGRDLDGLVHDAARALLDDRVATAREHLTGIATETGDPRVRRMLEAIEDVESR